MKAIVLAGGQGSRLRPLTVNRPKPLLPVVNRPVIVHIVDWLKRNGVYDIILTVQHQADWFQGLLGSGTNLGVNIEYMVEDVPLGTAGGVAQARAHGLIEEGETVLVVSGDALTDIDLGALIEFHRNRQADVTVAFYRVSDPVEYGLVITEADGHITQFVEKPGWAEVVSDLVNTGIYVMETPVIDLIPLAESYDFSNDLFPRLLAEKRRIFGHESTGYWCDVGTPAAYLQANKDMLNNLVQHESLGTWSNGDVWLGENVEIDPSAQLFGPIYLGHNVHIKAGAIIQGPAVIRDDTVVDERASISHTVIWRGCYIGEDAQVHGALISRQCVLRPKAAVQEGVVIGDRCVIGEGAIIFTNVKLWPGKEIDPSAMVRESIIWGAQGRRVLFSRFGVSGMVNVELTPEFAAKLGVAFGASLPRNAIVTINRDSHPSSRMIKRAIISGLPAAGVKVRDLRTQPIPVARYFTRDSGAAAGVHVRISPHDRRMVDVNFFDTDGRNLGRAKEREVERLFFREDFRRAQYDDIGTIEYAAEVEQLYKDAFLEAIDASVIRQHQFKIAVDYVHATTVEVLEPLLAQLDVEVMGLNTRIDADYLAVSEEAWERGIEPLARLVEVMGLHLGARLDVSGSKVSFVDHKGHTVSDVLAAAAMAALIWHDQPGALVIVPVDRPAIFEQLAARQGGRVLRTRIDPQALMTAAVDHGAAFATDAAGSFIFPTLHPVPDGMFALASMLQYLARRRSLLADIVATLPASTWLHQTVPCAWDAKGRVMRQVNERAEFHSVSTIDGVRFLLDDRRWVLIRPDPDRALLHVYAEAADQKEAQRLLDEHLAWLRSLNAPQADPFFRSQS